MQGTIRVFHAGEGKSDTTQTSGMRREELVSSANAWVGLVSTAPHFVSGWHHHGEYDTYIYVISGQIKMEFGQDGKESCEAKSGEVLHVPQHTVHRETNPSDEKQLLFGVRVGHGASVTNVAGPDQ
jgi:uncharacterized RmlC-like cupin family protein